jgi:hypothetical protein
MKGIKDLGRVKIGNGIFHIFIFIIINLHYFTTFLCSLHRITEFNIN